MTWVSSDILKASSILLNLVVWNLNILKKKIERKKKKPQKFPPQISPNNLTFYWKNKEHDSLFKKKNAVAV